MADAAELAGQALRLTPPGASEYDGRLLALARYLIDAGEDPRAAALLAERAGALPPGPVRAAVYLLLGEGSESLAEVEQHLARAIADSAAAPGLRAQALARLAFLQVTVGARRIAEAEQMAGQALAAAASAGPDAERRALLLVAARVERIGQAEQIAGQALAAAASAGPDAEREALVALAWARVMRGRGVADLAERAAAVPPGATDLYRSAVDWPGGVRLAFRGELAAARKAFQQLLAVAEQRGEARSAAVLTLQLCEVELRAGDTAAAARALGELDQWAALEPDAARFRARAEAVLAAVRGDPGDAQALAARVLAASGPDPYEWDRLEARRAAGLAALLARDPQRAVTSLAAVWEHTRREGVDDPGAFPVAGDLAEALAEAGRAGEAHQVIARLRGLAAAQRHPWGLATADRSAAVVALAGGYDETAAAQLAGAAAACRALGAGWDAARALLVLGRAQRRARKRAAARDSLQAARAGFEELGCPGWAQAAAAELDRISGRRVAPGGGLTPGERRVAELVASGLSNKQVAERLYLSAATVDTHLRGVYAKLGVTSRAQLARRLGAPR